MRRHQDLPSSWGISMIRLHMFLDAGGIADTRPIQCQNSALGACNAKAPPIGLSTLNSMAFGLAVYALPDGLPAYDTRLASGCWSGSAERGFHPQDSVERFQCCFLTSHPPLPSFLAQTRPPVRAGQCCFGASVAIIDAPNADSKSVILTVPLQHQMLLIGFLTSFFADDGVT